MDKGLLIAISEASRVLGVSEVTLRQWTDEGRVKAFITPGGHRRYSKGELLKLIGSPQHGIKEVIEKMELSPSFHLQIAQEKFAQTSWYKKLDVDSRRELGIYGRKILNLAIAYVAKPRKRDETLQLGRELGYELGEKLASLGLSLSDSLEAFLWHRSPGMNVIAGLTKGGGALSRKVVNLIPSVNHLLDEILLSLVKAYQDYRDEGKV
ncbi:MAG: helix-turn-helix domain-containing protein [Dehalococcoidia bacterium]|nr:helix-turn-helix domain-containing protein [Dehalococcoidia bacterium]